MKSSYGKLKLSILLQTLFVTALAVLVGNFLLNFVINGMYNEKFKDSFVKVLMIFRVSKTRAYELYRIVIGNNKQFFVVLGFLLLFALFFYISLSKMTRYLGQVEEGMNSIVDRSDTPIRLITELKPLEIRMNDIKKTLRKQEKEAEKAEQNKNDLVVFLAHDLKTPLTSVVAYLSMLDTHPEMSTEDRAKYTHISLEKAIRLGELINEFFDITRFNLQNIELSPMRLNITIMLEQLADEAYGLLQQKNLTCLVSAQEDLMMEGDPDKLARVFDNILRNAINYCEENTTIGIEAKKQDGKIRIEFSNQGKTIPKEELEVIFDKFYRSDLSRSSKTGGAGLGLAIAKRIVTIHGGTIFAKSENGKTWFVVILPGEEEIEDEGEDQLYTHSRHTSWSRTIRRKGVELQKKTRDLGHFSKSSGGVRRKKD